MRESHSAKAILAAQQARDAVARAWAESKAGVSFGVGLCDHCNAVHFIVWCAGVQIIDVHCQPDEALEIGDDIQKALEKVIARMQTAGSC